MNVQYRQLFLRDLKKLKKTEIYDRIYELAFDILPDVDKAELAALPKFSDGLKPRFNRGTFSESSKIDAFNKLALGYLLIASCP